MDSDRTAQDDAFPTWDAATVEELRAFGDERSVPAGEPLLVAGRRPEGFFVVLDGEVEVVQPATPDPSDAGGDPGDPADPGGRGTPGDGREDAPAGQLVGTVGPGQFVGAVSLLTGQRPYLDVRAARPTRVLAITPDGFRRVMSTRRALATTIFSSVAARSDSQRIGPAARTVRILGSRFSRESLALRAYVTRSRVPHTWIDLDEVDDPDMALAAVGLGPDDVPAVITPAATLRRATPGELAARLGLAFDAPPGYTFDLVVVGGGPAGLAAAVYGAAEGLETVALDAVAAGGQAGTSTLIENYAGFPMGIAGGDLAARTAAQARRLGARVNAPCRVTGLRPGPTFHTLVLDDGSEVPARAVIVATGARYRRLPLDELARYEGAGVYYAATAIEARGCRDEPVVVVGGGNSAGQAALFLAEQGSRVRIVVRRDGLAATMSHYLIARIEADARIDVCPRTEVRALEGEGHLRAVTLEQTAEGRRETVDCTGLFCFIGAEPTTDWLDGTVALDASGFVLTDRSLPEDLTGGPAFAARSPLAFETSVPGVFAVGDARSGSLKRVAAAIGEGSSAVRSVHDHLARA